MPIYDYACAGCGARFEHMQSGTELKHLSCPTCGSSSVSKLVSIPGLIKAGSEPRGGKTCCGREERCDKPPCSNEGSCHRGH